MKFRHQIFCNNDVSKINNSNSSYCGNFFESDGVLSKNNIGSGDSRSFSKDCKSKIPRLMNNHYDDLSINTHNSSKYSTDHIHEKLSKIPKIAQNIIKKSDAPLYSSDTEYEKELLYTKLNSPRFDFNLKSQYGSWYSDFEFKSCVSKSSLTMSPVNNIKYNEDFNNLKSKQLSNCQSENSTSSRIYHSIKSSRNASDYADNEEMYEAESGELTSKLMVDGIISTLQRNQQCNKVKNNNSIKIKNNITEYKKPKKNDLLISSQLQTKDFIYDIEDCMRKYPSDCTKFKKNEIVMNKYQSAKNSNTIDKYKLKTNSKEVLSKKENKPVSMLNNCYSKYDNKNSNNLICLDENKPQVSNKLTSVSDQKILLQNKLSKSKVSCATQSRAKTQLNKKKYTGKKYPKLSPIGNCDVQIDHGLSDYTNYLAEDIKSAILNSGGTYKYLKQFNHKLSNDNINYLKQKLDTNQYMHANSYSENKVPYTNNYYEKKRQTNVNNWTSEDKAAKSKQLSIKGKLMTPSILCTIKVRKNDSSNMKVDKEKLERQRVMNKNAPDQLIKNNVYLDNKTMSKPQTATFTIRTQKQSNDVDEKQQMESKLSKSLFAIKKPTQKPNKDKHIYLCKIPDTNSTKTVLNCEVKKINKNAKKKTNVKNIYHYDSRSVDIKQNQKIEIDNLVKNKNCLRPIKLKVENYTNTPVTNNYPPLSDTKANIYQSKIPKPILELKYKNVNYDEKTSLPKIDISLSYDVKNKIYNYKHLDQSCVS